MDNENLSGMALPTGDKTVSCGVSDGWTAPDFKVSGIFSSHMVLQREKPIKIWGFSNQPGSKIISDFDGEGASATVGGDFRFELTFSARLCSNEPKVMHISDDRGHSVTFDDILIGDVWLIGGQSNAELNLAPCMSYTPSVEFYDGDNFRLFSQTQYYPFTHQELCERPQRDVINPEWCWSRPDKDASLRFSAVGWYFAREMTKQTDVPLGMVMMCAGGACIRELVPDGIAHTLGYDYGANVRESGYYNTLIAPWIPLPFKAMIFFQGESEGLDRALAERYTYELAVLVADERRSFGFEFPFYNIQLSDYTPVGADIFKFNDIIRIQQFDAVKVIPNSTLTVDYDLGSPYDYSDWAHSPRKLELAERLARLALAREYGIGKESENASPSPVSAVKTNGGKAFRIEFTNVGGGLIVSGQTPADSVGREVHGFTFGPRGAQTDARATIVSRCTVEVEIPENADTSSVSYAFYNLITPEAVDLRNAANLPCPAFSLTLRKE